MAANKLSKFSDSALSAVKSSMKNVFDDPSDPLSLDTYSPNLSTNFSIRTSAARFALATTTLPLRAVGMGVDFFRMGESKGIEKIGKKLDQAATTEKAVNNAAIGSKIGLHISSNLVDNKKYTDIPNQRRIASSRHSQPEFSEQGKLNFKKHLLERSNIPLNEGETYQNINGERVTSILGSLSKDETRRMDKSFKKIVSEKINELSQEKGLEKLIHSEIKKSPQSNNIGIAR